MVLLFHSLLFDGMMFLPAPGHITVNIPLHSAVIRSAALCINVTSCRPFIVVVQSRDDNALRNSHGIVCIPALYAKSLARLCGRSRRRRAGLRKKQPLALPGLPTPPLSVLAVSKAALPTRISSSLFARLPSCQSDQTRPPGGRSSSSSLPASQSAQSATRNHRRHGA